MDTTEARALLIHVCELLAPVEYQPEAPSLEGSGPQVWEPSNPAEDPNVVEAVRLLTAAGVVVTQEGPPANDTEEGEYAWALWMLAYQIGRAHWQVVHSIADHGAQAILDKYGT